MLTSLVRSAVPDDHQQISNLIFFEPRLHRHLDWRSPLDWLGAPFYWALEDGRQVTAALACPEEVPGIAWLRLFVYAGHWSAEAAWQLLWQTAQQKIAQAGGAQVAAIVMQGWFQRVLGMAGFENRQNIVMLEWQYQPQAWREAEGVRIRKMVEADLEAVRQVDALAFAPLWQISGETLRRAFRQSLLASVAETEQGIIGYQLSTGSGQRAHLARLAVAPAMQGRGVGRGLVQALFAQLVNNGVYKVSVNTQNDNASSLSLYQRLGFLRTGEQYPVYTFDIPAS